jgi:hypothetical protein
MPTHRHRGWKTHSEMSMKQYVSRKHSGMPKQVTYRKATEGTCACKTFSLQLYCTKPALICQLSFDQCFGPVLSNALLLLWAQRCGPSWSTSSPHVYTLHPSIYNPKMLSRNTLDVFSSPCAIDASFSHNKASCSFDELCLSLHRHVSRCQRLPTRAAQHVIDVAN